MRRVGLGTRILLAVLLSVAFAVSLTSVTFYRDRRADHLDQMATTLAEPLTQAQGELERQIFRWGRIKDPESFAKLMPMGTMNARVLQLDDHGAAIEPPAYSWVSEPGDEWPRCVPHVFPLQDFGYSSSGADGITHRTDALGSGFAKCDGIHASWATLDFSATDDATNKRTEFGRYVVLGWYRPWGDPYSPFGTTDPMADLRRQLARLALVALVPSLLVGLALAVKAQLPVTRARRVAEAITAGDLTARIQNPGGDDLGRMAAAINRMADQLTGQIDELTRAEARQRQFTSDVAHELRTPTAALLASAEALENPATREAAAARVTPQLRRLAGLTEDLLEISRMDAGHASLRRELVDVADLVRELATELGDPGDVQVLGGPATADVDPVRLRVAVRNLVANALLHGRPPALVTVLSTPESVVIDVTDQGAGVPEELRATVFDRFVRGDASRHGHSNGLGLAIARENIRLHGGELSLEAQGRVFRIALPSTGSGTVEGTGSGTADGTGQQVS